MSFETYWKKHIDAPVKVTSYRMLEDYLEFQVGYYVNIRVVTRQESMGFTTLFREQSVKRFFNILDNDN